MNNLAAAVERAKIAEESRSLSGYSYVSILPEDMRVILDGLDRGAGGGVDYPENDATDFAHPTWWRGHTYSVAAMCREVTKILDGEWSESAACSEPWETLRQRLRALVTRPPASGLAELTDEEASRAYETMHDVISMSGYGGDGQQYRVNAMKAAFNRVIQDREAAREFLGKVDG